MSGPAIGRRRKSGPWWRAAARRCALAVVGASTLGVVACGGGETIEVRRTVPYGRQLAPAAVPARPSPLATAPTAESFGEDALVYRVGSSPCAILRAGLDGLAAGMCGEELSPRVYLRPDRPLRLAELISRYASFEVEDGDEKVAFHGRGAEVAGAVEQRLMLEWARRLMAEAHGVAGTRGYRLALEWHRQFQGGRDCESVAIYLSGEALATTCDGLRSAGTVPAGRMAAILAWHDRLLPFQAVRERRDGNEQVSTRLIVPGAGGATQDDDTVKSMVALAETIHREILAGDLLRREEAERQRLAALEPPPSPPGRPSAAAPVPVAPATPEPEVAAGDLTLSEAIAVGADPEQVEEEAEPYPGAETRPPAEEEPAGEPPAEPPPDPDDDGPGTGPAGP
ncbi:MAG TPA: hypothetical protein VM617_07245 [Thermoanaerobaculia bacterium]|nr:hypothetical protein [Thermoanaerobaculia bacterium]